MKNNILIILTTIILTLVVASSKAEELVTTTKVDLQIHSSESKTASNSSLHLIDSKPANLVFYDQEGMPQSRIQIKSKKLKHKNNSVIKLDFELYEYEDNQWHTKNNSSIMNYANEQGEVSISSSSQHWQLTARATSGADYKQSDAKYLNYKECDLNSISKNSLESNFFDSPEKDKDGCCSASCQDGSGHTMKCCGAIECCGCGTCCRP